MVLQAYNLFSYIHKMSQLVKQQSIMRGDVLWRSIGKFSMSQTSQNVNQYKHGHHLFMIYYTVHSPGGIHTLTQSESRHYLHILYLKVMLPMQALPSDFKHTH